MSVAGNELTAPFWEAASRSELVRPVCGGCHRSFFTPKFACPHCGCEKWAYEPSSGRGTVATYSVVHHGPDPRFTTPYVLAVVDISDEGWSLMTNIVGVSPGEIEIGMRVGVEWTEFEGQAMPAFTAEDRTSA